MEKKVHHVEVTKTDELYLYLKIDGQACRFRWVDCSPKLASATQTERAYLEVSPSGYGIHWPHIDENLAITPLLEQAEEKLDLAADH